MTATRMDKGVVNFEQSAGHLFYNSPVDVC